MDKYIIALDLSLSRTGLCIFDKYGNPIEVSSIPTSNTDSHGKRLKSIADCLYQIRKEYDIELAVLEKGFTRFNASTQAIFKCHGIANYIFWDCEQIYYAPSTIKKLICGKGNADKNEVEKEMRKRFPQLIIDNQDESDACSIGCAYFMDKRK